MKTHLYENDAATGKMPARYKAIFMIRCAPTFAGHGGSYENAGSAGILPVLFAAFSWFAVAIFAIEVGIICAICTTIPEILVVPRRIFRKLALGVQLVVHGVWELGATSAFPA